LRISFCALRAQGLFFYLVWAACAGRRGVYATGALKKAKQGLPFENKLLCPAGTAAFLLFSLGRLRGGRQMGAC